MLHTSHGAGPDLDGRMRNVIVVFFSQMLRKLHRMLFIIASFPFHIINILIPYQLYAPLFHVIFVVYPGRSRDAQKYGVGITCLRKISPFLPIGIAKSPGVPLSLVICYLYTTDELLDLDGDKLRVDMSQLVKKYRAKCHAFAGILPSLLHKKNAWPQDELKEEEVEIDCVEEHMQQEERSLMMVKGCEATVYMIIQNIREAISLHSLDQKPLVITIVGAGFAGSKVANRCALEFKGVSVRAIDTRAKAKENLDSRVDFFTLKDAPQALETSSLVVLLIRKGDAFLTKKYDFDADGMNQHDNKKALSNYLSNGTVLISDTHPKLSNSSIQRLNEAGICVYESALTLMKGFQIIPKLPMWRNDTVPGCLGEAFVRANASQIKDEEDFDSSVGSVLKARLDLPQSAIPEMYPERVMSDKNLVGTTFLGRSLKMTTDHRTEVSWNVIVENIVE